MNALLRASHLALRGRLQPTDFAMLRPQLLALVGPNGSGKTSLLHALAGIGSPAGAVQVDEVDPSRCGPDERRRLLSYLPASREAAWPVSARDLIALGLPSAAMVSEIDDALASLSLSGMADRRVDRMSTGERSRVLIARALAPRPRVLLLDEPVANLDPYWQLRLMERLQLISRRDGQGVIIALHDLDLAARFADRLVMMDGGRIAADGDPATLLASDAVPRIFGIERAGGAWQAVNRLEDPRSSP